MSDGLYGLVRGYASVSLIGMCKNAGKTTALNHLVGAAGAAGVTLGLTSIGRDGEDTDLATGTAKPGIWVRAGSLLATAAGLLRYCDACHEILESTGITTPLGEVVVLRALGDGWVQLAGPSMVSQLEEVNTLLRRFGARQILIDGAISRKSLASRRVSEATVLCTGASCGGSLAAVVRQAGFFCDLALLPEVQHEAVRALAAQGAAGAVLVGRENLPVESALTDALCAAPGNATRFVWLGGALTNATLTPLVTGGANLRGLTLVVQDASRLLVTQDSVQKLAARGARLAVVESINLAGVAVNPFSAYGNPLDKDELLAAMARRVPVPVLNVAEIHAEGGGA